MTGSAKKISRTKGISRINIGLILFALLLLYMIVIFVLYLRTDKIRGYQVLEGSLSSDNLYEGLILRKETPVTAQAAGYVNYFAAEGSRVAVGNLVYTVDESGNLMDYLLSQGAESFQLDSDDLTELRTQIVNYEASFSEKNFHTVYEFKTQLNATVNKLSNRGVLENIASLNDASAAGTIQYCNAADTGIVVYSVDGYEGKTRNDITAADFDTASYEKTQMVSNALVSAGDAVYKLCTDDNWEILIRTDEETADMLEKLDYIRVKFLKNQDVSWAKAQKLSTEDGETIVSLSFNNSMQVFCTDRFLNIELILTDVTGLKIPNSAIVEQRFFVVPDAYLTDSAEGGDAVLRRTVSQEGEQQSETIALQITHHDTDAEESYVEAAELNSGDVLLLPGGSEGTFTIGQMHSLQGVYNINRGYAEFKEIEILSDENGNTYQNDEYAIVKSNSAYGLNAYDYIVLDASSVEENQMVYN